MDDTFPMLFGVYAGIFFFWTCIFKVLGSGGDGDDGIPEKGRSNLGEKGKWFGTFFTVDLAVESRWLS